MTEQKSVTILERDYDKSVHNIIKLKDKEKYDFEQDMKEYAKMFLRQNFNMNLRIPIKIDGRLTRAGGSFHFFSGKNKRADMIKMSERFIACALHDEEDGIEAILDVLRHELVHYALFEQGKNFSDGADDLDNPKRIQKYEIDRYCYIKDFINALEVRYVDEIFEIGNGITVKGMIEWLEKIDNKEKEVAVFDYDRGIEISIDSKVGLSKKIIFNSSHF